MCENISVFIPIIFKLFLVEVATMSAKNTVLGVIYRLNSEPLVVVSIFSSTLLGKINIVSSWGI